MASVLRATAVVEFAAVFFVVKLKALGMCTSLLRRAG